MQYTGNWFLGACTAIMAVAALFVASHAGHGVAYYGGLGMFVFCVLFIMNLVKVSTGHAGVGERGH